ncbi:MAG: YybH family protein [Thermoanaerobaculia bacterium]
MTDDETVIRDIIQSWHRASTEGDVDTVLGLMSDDVVFLVAGQQPMAGRMSFEKVLRSLASTHRIESSGDVQEVKVSGDMAYAWSFLNVQMTPIAGGETSKRSGNVLSIFNRQPGGSWQLTRDANLLLSDD